MSLDPALLERLAAILGPSGLLTADLEPYLAEQRGLFRGTATAVARPAETAQLAELVRLCAAAGVTIVPQGGNTGLVGGAVAEAGQLIVSLTRMARIRALDADNATLTAEAGCILADVQAAAEAADLFFPLSLAAEGSCRIGGTLSTNAGGVNVLRYGNARDQVLGLEVVLADGRVWNGLRALRKDNTGLDLKHLFIGAEGTLGIITAAVLKLYPRPRDVQTALVAVTAPEAVLTLLRRARAASGDAVTACEMLPRLGMEFVTRHSPGCTDPFDRPWPWYVLMELSSSRPDGGLAAVLEAVLAQAIEDGLVGDAVLADSLARRDALWRLRESLPEAQKHEGASIKHDVAVPVSQVPAFLRRAEAAVTAALPGVRICAFGHVGDGNIHYNLSQPPGADGKAFLARWEEANRIVHDIVTAMDGSISAEHGIGRLKRDELAHYKDPLDLDLMARLKGALDPAGVLNPGVMLSGSFGDRK